MKKALFYSAMLLSGFAAFSQKPNYNEVILPQQADSQIVSAMGLSPYEEKLVQLAWQNYPASEIYNSKVRIAEKKISLERFDWTNDVKASFNFNQRNIESGLGATEESGNNYYPWYNFGVSVSLGSFVHVPMKTSIAKEELDIANAYVNQQKLSIRAEVLKRYKDYQLKVELLKIRTQAQDDAYATHQLITRDFEKGAATLEEFIKSAAAYNTSVEAKLIADKDVLETKISLEEMIGVKLEEVGK